LFVFWLFWAQAVDHDGTNAGVWSINTATSNIENPVWSEPGRLTNGVMMCKPIVLSDGSWVLPASTWRLTDHSAKVIMSNDKGLTWYEQGAVNVPKDDGNSWSKGLLLDERKGISYPDGQQIEDGSVCIIYDYNRTKEQMILMTSLTEDDILGDDYDSRMVEVNRRRKIISEGCRTESPK
jgi:hypothetical protein